MSRVGRLLRDLDVERRVFRARRARRAAEALSAAVAPGDFASLVESMNDPSCNFWKREVIALALIEHDGFGLLGELADAYEMNRDAGYDDDGFGAALHDLFASDPDRAVGLLEEMRSGDAPRQHAFASWWLHQLA